MNVTVIIHYKGGYWNCAIRIVRILDSLREYSYGQSVKYESFFVLAFYVDEAALRHVHIQGRNTTKKTMTCHFCLISPFTTARKIAGIY